MLPSDGYLPLPLESRGRPGGLHPQEEEREEKIKVAQGKGKGRLAQQPDTHTPEGTKSDLSSSGPPHHPTW
jgi:hypothetical protein